MDGRQITASRSLALAPSLFGILKLDNRCGGGRRRSLRAFHTTQTAILLFERTTKGEKRETNFVFVAATMRNRKSLSLTDWQTASECIQGKYKVLARLVEGYDDGCGRNGRRSPPARGGLLIPSSSCSANLAHIFVFAGHAATARVKRVSGISRQTRPLVGRKAVVNFYCSVDCGFLKGISCLVWLLSPPSASVELPQLTEDGKRG